MGPVKVQGNLSGSKEVFITVRLHAGGLETRDPRQTPGLSAHRVAGGDQAGAMAGNSVRGSREGRPSSAWWRGHGARRGERGARRGRQRRPQTWARELVALPAQAAAPGGWLLPAPSEESSLVTWFALQKCFDLMILLL